jgi:hypothetical protein
MKAIIQAFSSLTTAFYLLAAQVFWLLTGMILAGIPPTEEGIHRMNREIVIDWLFSQALADRQVLAWFIGLCLLNLLLFANIVFCSATQLLQRARRIRSARGLLLFLLHILVLLIMAGHAANMTTGFKQAEIPLTRDAPLEIRGGTVIELEDVHYRAPLAYLDMKQNERHRLGRKEFAMEKNFALLRLTQSGGGEFTGRLHLLQPWELGALRITLNRFFLSKTSPDTQVGVVVTVAKNPLHEIFFLVYAVFILSLILYLMLSAGRTGKDEALGLSIKPPPFEHRSRPSRKAPKNPVTNAPADDIGFPVKKRNP